MQWRVDDAPKRFRSTFLRQLLVVTGIVGHAQCFQVQGLIISVHREGLVVAVASKRVALAVVNPGTQLTPCKYRPPGNVVSILIDHCGKAIGIDSTIHPFITWIAGLKLVKRVLEVASDVLEAVQQELIFVPLGKALGNS